MDTRDSNDIGKDKVTFKNLSTNDINVHHSCFKKSVQNILPVVHNDTKVKLSCGKKKRASETSNEIKGGSVVQRFMGLPRTRKGHGSSPSRGAC